MKKKTDKAFYEVTAEIRARATITIKANSEDEAIDIADTAFTCGEVEIRWYEGGGAIYIYECDELIAREEK